MSHKTLINGTAYNITSGKSLVSGTIYNISSGKTLVSGTGYNINLRYWKPTAMLYDDGDFIFQMTNDIKPGKTLIATYTDFDNFLLGRCYWKSQINNIKNVYFEDNFSINTAIDEWFYGASNLQYFNIGNSSKISIYNMWNTFKNCKSLISKPFCGRDTNYMVNTYANCYNLVGEPVCGPYVTYMDGTYSNCYNLTGNPICGANVQDVRKAYFNCKNIGNNAYFYSNKITGVYDCFGNRNILKQLNIYVHAGTTTNTSVHRSSTSSLIGKNITWTNAGNYQYNTVYNIYIYPVANVEQARIDNGD